MNDIFILLSFCGLTFLIKESDIFSIPRNWVMRKSVFLFNLLSCYFCTGWWSGIILYFISFQPFNIFNMITWGLSSAVSSLLFSFVIKKFGTEEISFD